MNKNKSSISTETYKKCINEMRNELHSKSKVINLFQKLESLTEIEKLIQRNLKLLEIKQTLIKQAYELKCSKLDKMSSGDFSNCKCFKTKNCVKLPRVLESFNAIITPSKLRRKHNSGLFFEYISPEKTYFKKNQNEIFPTRQSSFVTTTEKEITLENEPRYCCFHNSFQYSHPPFVPKISSISIQGIPNQNSNPSYYTNKIKTYRHCPRCGFDYYSPTESIELTQNKSIQTAITILEPQIKAFNSSRIFLQSRSRSLNTLHFSVRSPYSSETTNTDSQFDISYLLLNISDSNNGNFEFQQLKNIDATISTSDTGFDISHLLVKPIVKRPHRVNLKKGQYFYITQVVPGFLKSRSMELQHFDTIDEDFLSVANQNLNKPNTTENDLIKSKILPMNINAYTKRIEKFEKSSISPKWSSINLCKKQYTKTEESTNPLVGSKCSLFNLNKEKFIRRTDPETKNEATCLQYNKCTTEDPKILSLIKRFEDFEKDPSFYVNNDLQCNANRKTADHLTINCNKDGCTTFKHTCSTQLHSNCLQNIKCLPYSKNVEKTNCCTKRIDTLQYSTNDTTNTSKRAVSTPFTSNKHFEQNKCLERCFQNSKTILSRAEEYSSINRNNAEIRKSCTSNTDRPIKNILMVPESSSYNDCKCTYFKQNNSEKLGTAQNNTKINTNSDKYIEETFWFKIIEKFIQYTILDSKKCSCVLDQSKYDISRSYTTELSRNMDEIIELMITVRNNYRKKNFSRDNH